MKTSLLKKHMDLLSGGAAEGVYAETQRIESIQLRPLNFSRQKSRGLKIREFLWFLFPLACAGGAFVTFPKDESLLRIKGQSHVWLYWERDGQVKPWMEGMSLKNGDRVRAEILTPAKAHAMWFVTDAQGELLSSRDAIGSDKLSLAEGERKEFPGSFQLVGENQNENLFVALCENGGSENEVQKAAKKAAAQEAPQMLSSNCVLRKFSLRKEIR